MNWRNRIIGEAMVSPYDLLAHPLNPKAHPAKQQEALDAILSEVGWVQRIIVNQRTGYVIDGHARAMLALRHNEAEVPVLYVDLSEQEEALVLALLDPIAGLAQVDDAIFSDLIQQVSTGDPALLALLDEIATETGIVPPVEPLETPIVEPKRCPHCNGEL